jgi:hypothetical protein
MRDRREFPDDGSNAPQWLPYPISHERVGDPNGTGFGSFFNHFSSKAELFEVAAADVLDELGALLDQLSVDVDDPCTVPKPRCDGFDLQVRPPVGLARIMPWPHTCST